MFFLTESVSSDSTDHLSLSEAYLGLSEATYAMSVANCDLLFEDFNIALSTQGLSESVSLVLKKIKNQLKLWFKSLIGNIKAIGRVILAAIERLKYTLRKGRPAIPNYALRAYRLITEYTDMRVPEIRAVDPVFIENIRAFKDDLESRVASMERAKSKIAQVRANNPEYVETTEIDEGPKAFEALGAGTVHVFQIRAMELEQYSQLVESAEDAVEYKNAAVLFLNASKFVADNISYIMSLIVIVNKAGQQI